ncbi:MULTISPECIES: murein biosynthesis integral membrane protein MurJ [Solibacillus]|uniref:Murein biosynthesis integral membrane protein MurJ n=1 Tax=Solibacillus merdavium TaxID=2762218 RepID=A0ABR8XHM8_9BACL|nr:murein biosynthesis integral membrane protein MurJ [Solibacillus merdavium]MBD8031443.1 murein biosynthesis integral membrane protein MurJ [Solibacillus merdavium]
MNGILKIIGAVAVINILARLVGFARETYIATYFGTTVYSDSIINAYTIPNFLYLVIGGAFTTAFISVYHKTTSSITEYIRRTFTTILITITLVVILFIVLADPILMQFFHVKDKAEYEILRSLYFWMMPSTIMLVLSTWMSGILNVQGRYHLSAFSVLIYNGAFLIVSVVLSIMMGPIGMGIGALVGAVCMFLFLVYGVRNVKEMSFKPSIKGAEDQKMLWKIALPILLGGATAQLYILIQSFFSAMLEEGVRSAMNYATKMSQFPQAILMTAVTTVIFPLLSRKEGEGDTESVKALYVRGMRLLYILVLPVSVFFYFQAEAIIRIIFEYNKFGAESTAITAPLLQVFSTTMFFLAANTYITRFYYAKGNSVLPMIFSILTVFGVNIAVVLATIDVLGANAVALGTLVSAIVNFLLLIIVLHSKYQLKLVNKNIGQFIKLAAIGLLFIVVNWAIAEWIVLDQKWMHIILTFVIASISYFIILFVFKIQELQQIVGKVSGKISRKK